LSWWGPIVEFVQSLILSAGTAVGDGAVAGILLVTLGVRLVLIPIMLPFARKSRHHSDTVRGLRPELDELKVRFKKQPDDLQKEMTALHARHGIGLVDGSGLIVALIQLPVLIALFQAVHSVSGEHGLDSNGLWAGLAAAALSVAALKTAGQAESKVMLAMSAILPVAICLWLGRGIGLYLIAFYAGSVVQGLLTRRSEASEPVAADG
jgi:YidC/Oxa1 family membrane protein insertase